MKFAIKPGWIRVKNITRRLIERSLNHTLEHFLCYLPRHIGLLLDMALRIFYAGIRVAPEQTEFLNDLHQKGIVVYAVKHKRYFDYLFAHTHTKLHRLPIPELALGYALWLWQPVQRFFQILIARLGYLRRHRAWPNPYTGGYIAREMHQGRAAFLHLIEKKGFYRRFVREQTDPIQHLVEVQQQTERPLFIVPLLIFFSKNPPRSKPTLVDMLFGTRETPGITRRMVMLWKKPGGVFAELSTPLNLKTFLQQTAHRDRSPEAIARVLRSELLSQINRHRQSITGPVLKSSEELKERILTSNRLRAFMADHARETKKPLSRVLRKADGYLDEISARYNMSWIKFGSLLITLFLKLMFEGFTLNERMLKKVKDMSQKGHLVFVPCHKSHIDYLIFSYILYLNNMPVPHVAAGRNLSFWPLGPFFRGGGAFFLRRTFKGKPLYAKVFAAYMHALVQEGFSIEFFIEGGRSRTGKLILPKLGLLSILLDAYKQEICKDLIFVPIFIGYDRVLEERAYLHELEGGKKEPESFAQVLKARRFLKKRYGKIYVNIHEPFSLNALLGQQNLIFNQLETESQAAFCRNLGHRIVHAINSATVVTPHGLVAAALLNLNLKQFSFDEVASRVETLILYLYVQNAQLADTLLVDQVAAIRHTFEAFLGRKFIEPLGSKDAGRKSLHYTINSARRPSLEYYKNNSVAFFIPLSFCAVTILSLDAFQFRAGDLHQGYKSLQEFFKNEFAYDVERSAEYYVRKSLKAFIDDAVLVPHATLPDTYNLTASGFRRLQFFSRFLRVYFESYWITLNYIARQSQPVLTPKTHLRKVHSHATRMLKREEIDLPEALSRIYFQNALAYFAAHNVRTKADEEPIAFFAGAIQRFLGIIG